MGKMATKGALYTSFSKGVSGSTECATYSEITGYDLSVSEVHQSNQLVDIDKISVSTIDYRITLYQSASTYSGGSGTYLTVISNNDETTSKSIFVSPMLMMNSDHSYYIVFRTYVSFSSRPTTVLFDSKSYSLTTDTYDLSLSTSLWDEALKLR